MKSRSTLFFLLFLYCFIFLTQAFYNGPCRDDVSVTSIPVPIGTPNCTAGGEYITITTFNTTKSFFSCNVTGSMNATDASNVFYSPLYQQLFNNQSILTVKAALDIASTYFTTMQNATILPGFTCKYGGMAYTFSSIDNAMTINNCNESPDYSVSVALGIGVSPIDNSTATSLTLRPIAGAGAASVSLNGSVITVYVAPSSFAYTINETTVAGQSVISVFGVDFTTLKKFKDTDSLFWVSDIDGIMANINFVVTDASFNGTSFVYYTDGLSLILKTLIVSGALSLTEANGTLYLYVPSVVAGNFTVTATPDGVNPIASSSDNSTVLKSFVNTPTVQFSGTSTNISANALLTMQDAVANGSSWINGTTANTGILKTFLSNVPGLSIFDDGASLSLNWAIICSDGRPAILVDGISVCGWQFVTSAVFVGCSSGAFTLTWTNGSQTWCLPGPAVYSPATPSLWPANITIVDQALNYLGIYRAQNGVCPSAGQSMITVNGVSVCSTRIDPGPAFSACPGGKYDLDSGIASGTVCMPHIWDGSEVTVNTLNSTLFTNCGSLNDVTSTINCIWTEYIAPGLNNQTSASTIVYTPPFSIACQTQFTISAMLTFLIVGQLPNNTRNVYVNHLSGSDSCGGGTFANPWNTLAYALSRLAVVSLTNFYNIILTVGTHNVVGDLYILPNTQITTTGNARFTTINVTGNIYFNSSSWSLFSNTAAYTAFSGITIIYNQMILDYTVLGSYGPSSDAQVSLYNSNLFGNGIYVSGRGSTDLFHVNDADVNNDMHINCIVFHQEDVTMLNADTIITDANCTTPSVQSFTPRYHINQYLGTSSLYITQNTSTFHIEFHQNGFDDGTMMLTGTVQDELTIDADILPLNLFYNAAVKFETKANSKSMAQQGLSAYWPTSFMTADNMFLTLEPRAKFMLTSGVGGFSIIDSSSITTNVVKEFQSANPFITITNSSGLLTFTWSASISSSNPALLTGSFSNGTLQLNPVDSVSNVVYNSTTCFLHLGVYICQTQITAVSDSNCVNGTGYVINVGNGVSYSFCPSAFDNDTFSITYDGTGASPLKSVTSTGAVFKGSLGSANIAVTSGLNDNTFALVDNPIVNTLSAAGFYAINGSTFCYQNNAGFGNCFSAAPGLAATFSWKWPTSELVGGFLSLGPSGQMSWTATTGSSGSITYAGSGIPPIIFTNGSYTVLRGYTADSNIVLSTTATDVNIGVSPNPSFTSVTAAYASFTSHLDMNSLAGIYFWNTANTLSTILGISNSQATNLTFLLPTTAGNNGDLLGKGAGNQLQFVQPSVKLAHSNTVALTQNNPGAAVFVTMFPTGTISLTIPANTLIAGSKIAFAFRGRVSTNGGSTFSIRVRLDGATTYGTSTSSTSVILSAIPFTCEGFLSIFSAGAGGVALSSGFLLAFTSTTNAIAGFTSTSTVAIDTTVSHTFDVQLAFSASSAANTFTTLGSTMEHLRPSV